MKEYQVRLSCSPKRTSDIKGKIYGPLGLLYPRIMIQDDIDVVVRDLRKMCF